MAYQTHKFSKGDVLRATDMNNVIAGIDTLFGDLYDQKTKSSYEFMYETASISAPNYVVRYNYSTFSGWWGCCGKPQHFNHVRLPIIARADCPITTVTVKIFEMPPASEVTLNTSGRGVLPYPDKWTNELASKTVIYRNGLSTGTNIIEVDFDQTIENAMGKYLYIGIMCDNLVTMGLIRNTYRDIAYNPWCYYTTNGDTKVNSYLATDSLPYDYDAKEILGLACAFYHSTEVSSTTMLGTENGDKFFSLVNECLNNSDAFGAIFEETMKSDYLCGSINLTTNKAQIIDNVSSTFTGVAFPVGIVPPEWTSDGCMVQVSARSWNESTKPITRVWAYLYSVEKVPLSDGNYNPWSGLEPTLLRSGVTQCNCPIGETAIVSIPWSEGEFSNTDGKFLMLGYCCDTYNNRCFTGRSDASVCTTVDGNVYEALDTWYATSQDGSAVWSPKWTSQRANAWSLCTMQKAYELGDQFFTILEEALNGATLGSAPTSEVRLAAQYDLVVGDTFQLFYSGVIKSFEPEKDGVTIRCSKGQEFPRYWEYTPAAGEEGTYTLTLYTRRLDGTIISKGSTKIVVHSKLTNETTPAKLTCLAFGDSLTSGALWVAEGLRRIYGTDASVAPAPVGVTNTVVTYGKNRNSHNGFVVNHEGYGGWTWNSFLTTERGSDSTTNGIVVTLANEHGYDLNTVQKSIWTDGAGLLWELEDLPSTKQIKFNRGTGNNASQANTATPTTMTCGSLGLSIELEVVVWETTNPFYNEAKESLDFAMHATTYGADLPDVVACLLTWNGGGGTLDFDQSEKIETHMTKATQLLRAIHIDCPNAQIVVMGIQLPSLTGGSGYNYGANGGYADRISTAFYAFDYDKALEELVTNDEFGEYCHYIDTKGQFDAVWNMPYTTKKVNTRSSATEYIGTNGVHPNTDGYNQIGDAFYRALTKVIPLTMNSNVAGD